MLRNVHTRGPFKSGDVQIPHVIVSDVIKFDAGWNAVRLSCDIHPPAEIKFLLNIDSFHLAE